MRENKTRIEQKLSNMQTDLTVNVQLQYVFPLGTVFILQMQLAEAVVYIC